MFDFPVPNAQLTGKSATPVLRDDVAISSEVWSVAPRARQQYSWRPPDTWECRSESASSPKSPTKLPSSPSRRPKNKKGDTSASEFTRLRKNLRRMEASSPRTFVERLKEEWIEVGDSSVYRQLELERQLWMLSALRSLEKKHSPSYHPKSLENSSTIPIKHLSLYENQGMFFIIRHPQLLT